MAGAWGRWGGGRDRRPELERLAAEAEAAFLGMPDTDRAAVLEAVAAIGRAAVGLRSLPDEIFDCISRIVFKFVIELNMPLRKPAPAALVRQVLDGSPTLLGPHRQQIETLISKADAGG